MLLNCGLIAAHVPARSSFRGPALFAGPRAQFFRVFHHLGLAGRGRAGRRRLITVLSVMNGLESELRTRLLSLTAHASLNAAGAPIGDWRARIQQLQGSPGPRGAAPFLDTDAMLSRPPAMSGAIVRGIDPKLETQVSSIADAMREGKLSDLEPGTNRIILGRMLAYQLQVGVGDDVTVMIPGNAASAAGGHERRARAASARLSRGGHFRGRAARARQRIGAHQSAGCRGPSRPRRSDGIRLKFDDVLKAPQLARAPPRGSRPDCRCATGRRTTRLIFAPYASKRP